MSKRRRQAQQITCHCKRYAFPHRLTSGKCDGTDWANSYQIYVSTECSSCPLNKDRPCEVSRGLESIDLCAGYNASMHQTLDVKLPPSDTDMCGLNTYQLEE